MPSILLAVEGSARTLIWLEVTPSTNACAVADGARSGVSVAIGIEVRVAGEVEVTIREVGVPIVSSLRLELQPVYKSIKRMQITLENRIDTTRF